MRHMARRASPVNATVLLIALFGLSACGIFDRPRVPRGNAVDAEQLAQLRPGVQTRQDVQALLGSPSARGTFDEENWYYISAHTRVQPGRFLSIEDQRVVAVSFNAQGVVREVREVSRADSRPVTMVARETPVPGTERSLLQALFGNLGRAQLPTGEGATPGPTSTGRISR